MKFNPISHSFLKGIAQKFGFEFEFEFGNLNNILSNYYNK